MRRNRIKISEIKGFRAKIFERESLTGKKNGLFLEESFSGDGFMILEAVECDPSQLLPH